MLLPLRRLRRFCTPRNLSGNAAVLVLGVLVATAAAILQTTHLSTSVLVGNSNSPLAAVDQSIQDFLIRTQAAGPQADRGSDAARDPQSFITIVAIDERTIAELGGYGGGYPRSYHAQVVDNLLAAPPRVIAFDLGFFEPTADDALLAAAFDRARALPLPTSILLSAVGLAPHASTAAPANGGEITFDSSLSPLPILAARADVALANILPDDRGTIRSIPLFATVDGVERPSLGLAAVAAYLRRQPQPETRSSTAVQFAGRSIPIEGDAGFRIGYLGAPSQPYGPASTFRIVSFVDVLRGRLDPSIWRGGLVLIGALGATGLADDYWTPTSDQGRKMAGVEIHANVAASLFSSRFLRESSPPWQVAIIFAIAVLVALLTANLGAFAAWITTALLLAAYAAANACALYAGGLLLPFAAPLLAGVFSFSASAGYRFAAEQRQSRGLRAQATHEALHDPLTGLPNRAHLRQCLTDALAAPHAALLLFSIDRFRQVNESLGHHAGDLLLQHVTDRLKACAPPKSTIARLGGDQFAVLLPGHDAAAAARAGLAIVEQLRSTVLLSGQDVPVATRFGIVVYPEHGDDATTLLRRCELALSVAKQSPTGYAEYSTDQDAQAADRLALANSLRQAIDADELTLCFQPKVDCQSGALAGVEALARWVHPRLGEVSPVRFVALAEETGIIGSLTRWALDAALRQSRAWLDAGLQIPIAVNLSALDAQDPGLPLAVSDLLARWGVPAALLEVEITEGALLGQPAVARDVLLRLEAMGVVAALDDFGTGYSSLGYLQQFPVRALKIDQSFVAHMAESARDRTIVGSTIELGHNLGLVVVAEGVEDGETLELLRRLRCDLIQGYHVARPMPAAELAQWLANRQAGSPSTSTLPERSATTSVPSGRMDGALHTPTPAL